LLQNNYLKKIKEEIPGLQINNSEFLSHGWTNDVLIVNNDIVFRFPKEDFVKTNLTNEIALLNSIKKQVDFLIPEYSFVSKNIDFWWYKMINWRELNIDDIKKNSLKIANQIWIILSKLHSINIEQIDWIDKNISSHYSFENWYIEYIKWKYEQKKDNFSKEEYEYILDFIDNSKYIKIQNPVFTHYDFKFKNIIFNDINLKISWIIDFSDSAIYDKAIDFVELWDYSEDFCKKILQNYKFNETDLIDRIKYFSEKRKIFDNV